jgi:hypothetical protein
MQISNTKADDDRYHIRLRADSRTIRFYAWLYEANPYRINTCKLFWAYMFAPLILTIRMIAYAAIFVIEPLVDRYNEWLDAHRETRAARRVALPLRPPKPKKVKVGPSRWERALDIVSTFFSVTWAKYQRGITYGAIGVGGLVGTGIMGFLLYLLTTVPLSVFLKGLFVVGTIAGGAVGGVLIAVGFIWIYAEKTRGYKKTVEGYDTFKSTMKKSFHAFHSHTCAIVDVDNPEALRGKSESALEV